MESITQGAVGLISLTFLFTLFSVLSKDSPKLRYVSGIILTLYTLQTVSPVIKWIIQTDFSSQIEKNEEEHESSSQNTALIQSISAQLCKDIKKLTVNRFGIS